MKKLLSILSIALLIPLVSIAQPANGPVEGKNGMVVCVSPLAAEIGVKILKQGGNAVDAAVAVAFAEAVTWPEAGNIGGGGFMMVAKPGAAPTCFDYRETAPASAPVDLFASGQVTHFDHKAAGVPGTVRGLGLAHKRLGKLPWRDVVSPAVELAQKGFTVNLVLANGLNRILTDSQTKNQEFRRIFTKSNGESWRASDILIQKDLGHTLELIAENGPDAFYKGILAEQLEREMKLGGGLITRDDLAKYEAKERTPIKTSYRGFDVYGAPPPSSGGIVIGEMLNILENFDVKKHARLSPETTHLLIEVMKRGFADRARFLGDPDFVKIPPYLSTKDYAKKLASGIDLTKATPSAQLAPEILASKEGDSTTHFSIVDGDGMAVSNTYTLENSYGNRVMVRGSGFILNNEMTDFNPKPGITTTTGLIGTKANQIEPGKRMLSSMSPTIVLKDGKPVLVTGSPGGRTIINTVFCVLVNVLDYDMPIQEAVDTPRLHHQWFPDAVKIENLARHPELSAKLRELGHSVSSSRQGDAHSIRIDPTTGIYLGAADRRIDGKAMGY